MKREAFPHVRLKEVFTCRKETGFDGLPILSVTISDGVISRDRLTREFRSSLSHKDHLLVRRGDVVYNMMRMWQGASGVASCDGVVSPAYVVCTPKAEIDSDFAHQLLRSPSMTFLFWVYSHGLTDDRRRLYFHDFGQVPVFLPPLVEQKAIAAVLSTWDRAIEQTTALIAAKERLKQGLMQQLLSGKRTHRGANSPWRQCHLGDVFTERREPGHDELPMLSVTLDAGVVRRATLGKPVRTSLEHEEHLLVRRGDIAYNMMRMWQGGSGMAGEDGVVSPAYVVCAPTKEIDPRFAHHLFRSPRMIYLFWAYSYGLTDDRRRLYYEEFARVPVNLPSVQEQRRIAALIDNLDRERSLFMRRRKAIARQKRGLMQKLLTGQVRVPKSLLKKGAEQ